MTRTARLLLRHPALVAAVTLLALSVLALVVRGDDVVTRADADVVAWAARERTAAVVDVARAVTYLGNGFVLAAILLVAAGILVARGVLRPAAALTPVASLALGSAVSAIGKAIVGRPRPPAALHEVVERTSGYPSGHSTQSAAGWLALGLVLTFAVVGLPGRERRWALPAALVVVGGVGVSRVLLSVHSPTDVVAGWSLGAVCAVGSVAVLLRRTATGPRVPADGGTTDGQGTGSPGPQAATRP